MGLQEDAVANWHAKNSPTILGFDLGLFQVVNEPFASSSS
jgi:hypothetical protein